MQQFEITAKANTKEAEAQLKKLSRSTEEAAKANLNLADSFDELEKAESKNRDGFKLLDTITQGYSTKLINLGKQIKGGIEGVKGLSASFKGLKAALLSTGLGAIVVGLGVIIAYWDDIKDSITGATEESKAYKEAQSQILSAVSKVQAEITKMGDTIELAKQGTISKEEALRQYNDALGESVGYAESLEQAESLLVKNAATVIEVTKLKAQSEVLYAKAAEARAKVIAGDESLKPDWWDKIKDATVAAFSGINGASKFAALQGGRAIDNGREAIKTAEQLESSAAELQTKIAELQKNLEKGSLSPKEREKRNKEIKSLEDKAAAEAIKREKEKTDALERIRQGLIDTEEERRKEELRKIQADYDEQIALATKYYGEESETILALRQAQKDALDAQEAKFKEEDRLKAEEASKKAAEKLALDKENDLLSFEEQRAVIAQREALLLEDETINSKDRTDLLKTYSDKRKQIEEAELEAKKKTLGDTENALNQLSNIAGESTVAGKGFAVASATLNTYRGVSDALAATTATPFDSALKFINAAAILTNGLRNVKKIISVKIPNAKGGGGTGGASSPSGGAISQPPAFNVVGQGGTNQLAQVIGEQTQQPVQAYVVANDITSTQSLQRNIQTEAGLG